MSPARVGRFRLERKTQGGRRSCRKPNRAVWMVRTAAVIPDNERWLHAPEVAVGLSRARAWAKENLTQATDLSLRAIKRKLQRQVLTLLGVPLQAYRPQN